MAIGSACAPRTLVSTFVFVDGAHHYCKLAAGAALLFQSAQPLDLAVLTAARAEVAVVRPNTVPYQTVKRS